MQSGVSISRTWPTEARLLALAAVRADQPGDWTGCACPEGGAVDPYELAALVARFGAFDIVCAGTEDEGEIFDDAGPAERQQMRARQQRASNLTLASMERSGRAPGGADLGTEWMIARFFHEFDDHTRQRRLHAHNIVILVSCAQMAAAL